MHLTLFSLLLPSFALLASAKNFDWDCTHSLATCNNACYAFHCRGITHALTYDKNEKNRGPRRRDSGCALQPCTQGPTQATYGKFGNSCDEYPFASTHEGGDDATLRCVDSTENSSEGGQLGNFYKNQKVKDGASFGFTIKNYVGAPYCEQTLNCVNDGGEFIYDGTRYTNAKVKKSLPGFEYAQVNRNAERSSIRKFVGEDGVERLWLTPGNRSTLVGEKVWNEKHGMLSISSEVVETK
ncbi:hypothetical protein BT63DRAFT_454015 [Microthyrium microscopicum]|uniref:Deoxyribonuclease NucA/NucB domain-containing protein n=1 Tax=Microthyrium microscopicum TaxID=703497 RepID=A0A6A6UC51_9PEZI|nr:hypothetical protein BT63DRAFT_454015 [Microthyrium microscopicum]